MRDQPLPSPFFPLTTLAVLACVGGLVATPLNGQEPDSASIARADSARAAMSDLRPPDGHPTDVIDVLTFPVKVIAAPFNFVFVTVPSFAIGRFTVPRPPGFVARTFTALQEAGVHPGVHTSIGPRSGPAVSLRVDRFDPLELETAWSWKQSYRYRIAAGVGRGSLSLAAQALWLRDAQVAFYGIGSDTPERLALYRRQRFDSDLVASIDVRPIVLEGTVGYEEGFVSEPVGAGDQRRLHDTHDETTLYGVTDRLRYFLTSVGANLDLTNREEFQDRGFRFAGHASHYAGVKGTESSFYKLRFAAQSFIPLNTRQLLALAVRTETNRSPTDQIPFYQLAQLGGEPTALGYPDTRFSERDMLSLSAEWQYEIWRDIHNTTRIESFVHFGEGAVGRRMSDIAPDDWHASYAFGFRAVRRSGLLALVYLAFSDETVRVNISGEWQP